MAKFECPRNNTLEVNIDLDFDITGCTVYFMAKKELADLDAAAVMYQAVTVHDNAALGLTHFLFGPSAPSPRTTMTDIEPGPYWYDVKVKYPDGVTESWPPAKMKILKVVRDGAP